MTGIKYNLSGVRFRHTFVFRKENLTQEIGNKLQCFISLYHNEIMKAEKAEALPASNLHVYEDTLLLADNSHVSAVLILAFFGRNWLSFIQDLLRFQELFPTSILPREFVLDFILRDESVVFDDFR